MEMSIYSKQIPETYTMALSLDEGEQKYSLVFRSACSKSNRCGAMDGYAYSLNGRSYRDVESLWKETVEALSKDVDIGTNIYGKKVLRTYTSIPTFDSGDREWDSKEMEYLFYDGKNVQMVVLQGGYRIASLSFYEKLLSADVRMKPLFKKLGWPTWRIRWV